MKTWLEHNLLKLNLTDTMDQPDGFTRLSFSPEEWEARDAFIQIAKEMDLTIHEDEAGNVIARWIPGNPTEEKPAIALGSHVDTVTNGGGYDGVAGVLCGLGTVYQLKKEGFIPDRPIEVICFASEESARFGVSTIGSKAMSGMLDTEALAEVPDKDGVTIKQAMEERGLNYDESPKAERDAGDLSSFVELHIEQGTRIEKARGEVGAVTAIACPIRLNIDIFGKAGHTGTTPMADRQDALVSAAELISFIYNRALAFNEENDTPLVATASTISNEPNVMNVIPGKVTVGVDIRSVSDELKEKMAEEIRKKTAEIEETFRATINIQTLVNNPSIFLDESVHKDLTRAAEQAGLNNFTLESGAGHDVMNMARKWPSGLVFIPCKDGLSHHPEEHASLDDLEKGVKLLAAYIKNKAGD